MINKLCCSHEIIKTNHGLILKVHRLIQFIQEAWLKPYIDMNTDLYLEKQWKFEEAQRY